MNEAKLMPDPKLAEEKKLKENIQGEGMEALIERESDADTKAPEEKQGENMEAFLDRENDADDKEKKENIDNNEDKDDLKIKELHDNGSLKKIKDLIADKSDVWIKKSNGEWCNGKLTGFGQQGLFIQANLLGEVGNRIIKTEEFLKWQDEKHPLRTADERQRYIKTQESDAEKVEREEKEKPKEKAPESEVLEMHDLEAEKEDKIVDLEDLEDPKMKRLARDYEESKQKYVDKEKEFGSILTKAKKILGMDLFLKTADISDLKEYKKRYEKARDEMLEYKHSQTKNLSDDEKIKEEKRFTSFQDQGTVLRGDRERKIKEIEKKKKVENKKDNLKGKEEEEVEKKKNNFKDEEKKQDTSESIEKIETLAKAGKYEEALNMADSLERFKKSMYQNIAGIAIENGELEGAFEIVNKSGEYKDDVLRVIALTLSKTDKIKEAMLFIGKMKEGPIRDDLFKWVLPEFAKQNPELAREYLGMTNKKKQEDNSKKRGPKNDSSKEKKINLMEKYNLNKDDEPIAMGGKLIKKMSLGLSENWRSMRNLKFADLEGRIDSKLKKNVEETIEDLATLWGDEIRPDKNKKETVQAWLARAINNSLEKNEKIE